MRPSWLVLQGKFRALPDGWSGSGQPEIHTSTGSTASAMSWGERLGRVDTAQRARAHSDDHQRLLQFAARGSCPARTIPLTAAHGAPGLDTSRRLLRHYGCGALRLSRTALVAGNTA
jgi:hypothetical protein